MLTKVLAVTSVLCLFWIPSVTAHICDIAEPDTFICDPTRGGVYFFLCSSSGAIHEYACPGNLAFNNEKQRCDWPPANCWLLKGEGTDDKTTTTTRPAAKQNIPETWLHFNNEVRKGHPCDRTPPGTFICDPARAGAFFFLCATGDAVFEYACPAGLAFNNNKQACDWADVTRCEGSAVEQTPQAPQTTKASTTSTPSTTTIRVPQALHKHPCDRTPPGTFVCDPARAGAFFFLCATDDAVFEYACPAGLAFNNNKQACDWADVTLCEGSAVEQTPQAPQTTKASTTSTPSTTTIRVPQASHRHPCDKAPSGTFVCDPARVGAFFYCAYGKVFEYACPTGLAFNNDKQACDWAEVTHCEGSPFETNTQGPPGMSSTIRTSTTTRSTVPVPQGPCNEENCQLPDCRCYSTAIPGNISHNFVPQMVLLTFDDGINPNNEYYYNQLFPASNSSARKNPNGCRTKATFFVSGDYVDMQIVKALASRGNEIASHSRTHSSPSWWDSAKWDNEIQGMRQDLAVGTRLPESEIRGMRAPYLELGAELQFNTLQNNGFLYDSTFIVGSLSDDGEHPVWPFTLRFPPSHTQCLNGRCPQNSYPTLWEVPLIRQYTVFGEPCSMTDACNLPRTASKNDVLDFLWHNFNRHYNTNRSPFMISLHATWFQNVPNSLEALQDFLAALTNMPDVWQVSVTQALDWIQNPKTLYDLNKLSSWQC